MGNFPSECDPCYAYTVFSSDFREFEGLSEVSTSQGGIGNKSHIVVEQVISAKIVVGEEDGALFDWGESGGQAAIATSHNLRVKFDTPM